MRRERAPLQPFHIFKHNTRNCDILARYGGEEFVIIFPETAIDEALVVSQRICSTVVSTLGVSVTIGLSSLPQNSSDSHEIIRMADEADSVLGEDTRQESDRGLRGRDDDVQVEIPCPTQVDLSPHALDPEHHPAGRVPGYLHPGRSA